MTFVPISTSEGSTPRESLDIFSRKDRPAYKSVLLIKKFHHLYSLIVASGNCTELPMSARKGFTKFDFLSETVSIVALHSQSKYTSPYPVSFNYRQKKKSKISFGSTFYNLTKRKFKFPKVA